MKKLITLSLIICSVFVANAQDTRILDKDKPQEGFQPTPNIPGFPNMPRMGPMNQEHPGNMVPGNVNLGSNENTSNVEQVGTILNATTSNMDLNSDDGVFSWKGRTFDIGTSRIFRSRFERYLNQSERNIESQKEYQALLEEVISLLSPSNLKGSETVFTENVEKAYRLLYKASEYPQDGGTSRVLAHMIYNSWRMRDEIRETIRNMTEEDKRIAAQESIVQNRRFMADANMKDASRNMKQSEIDAYKALRGDSDYSNVKAEEDKLARQRASLEISGTTLNVQAKLAQFQFQSQIIYFILQRRFEHSLMASYFYRALFRGSAQQIQVGEQFLSRFFPQGDMIYTVEALEQISLEAINDTKNTMEVVNYSLEQTEIHSAMERLQECFYLGEFLEPVSTFPRELRQEILTYYRLLREARELMTLKDYDALLKVNQKLLSLSRDSRFNEVSSYANNAKQLSNLKLAQAKFLLSKNQYDQAQAAMIESATIWPANPELTNFTNSVFEQTDLNTASTVPFDNAIKNKDYRTIFNNRHEWGLGLSSDEERSAVMAKIVDQIGTVDLLLTQAKTLSQSGNHNGALELVLQAETIYPEDREVFTLKSQLLPVTQDFAKCLLIAEQFEKQGEYILSYSWYEKAKNIYPASQIVIVSQQRLLPKINNKL